MSVPTHIKNYRRELCASCPMPCEHQTDEAFHADPNSVCPIGRFPAYVSAQPNTRLRGLGDVVALVAKPVAKSIDKVFKTNYVTCRACAQRQQKLNNLLSFD